MERGVGVVCVGTCADDCVNTGRAGGLTIALYAEENGVVEGRRLRN